MRKRVSIYLLMILSLCTSCQKEEIPAIFEDNWDEDTAEYYQRKDSLFPDREEYVYLDYDARIKKLQLDPSFLSKLNTMELVQVCMSFPQMYDWIFYNNLIRGINFAIENFNGFEELKKRPDALICLTMYYNSYLNHISSIASSSPDDINPLELCSIELIILSGYLFDTATVSNDNSLIKVVTKSIAIRKTIPERLYGETFSNPVANMLIDTFNIDSPKFQVFEY